MDNSLVFGEHTQRKFNLEGMQVTVADDDKLTYGIDIIADTLCLQMKQYRKVFAHIPKLNYLVAVRKTKPVTEKDSPNTAPR
jgi:hypothetical protein